jgi:hypothetical protein
MALWVGVSLAVACLCIGFAVAVGSLGVANSELASENHKLMIENARLKEGRP